MNLSGLLSEPVASQGIAKAGARDMEHTSSALLGASEGEDLRLPELAEDAPPAVFCHIKDVGDVFRFDAVVALEVPDDELLSV